MSFLRSSLRNQWLLFKKAGAAWNKDNAFRLGAAISYYTVFSLAPLLLIAVSVAGLVFGKQAIQGELAIQLQGLLGEEGAKAIQSMIGNAWKPSSNILATVLGAVIFLLGATAVFAELRAVLNQIWQVPAKQLSGLWAMTKDRLLSFALIGAIGFLLLVSLVVSTVLAAAEKYFSGIIGSSAGLLHLVYSLVSFGLISALFASIYKVLPDAKIRWADVWTGAVITASLFVIGKLLIGLYLGRASLSSSYGASASLVVIMVWAYYSSLIFIFGAEFTHVFANRPGALERPSRVGSSPVSRL